MNVQDFLRSRFLEIVLGLPLVYRLIRRECKRITKMPTIFTIHLSF